MDPSAPGPRGDAHCSDPLEQIARELLDGREVDWPALRHAYPRLRTRLDFLRCFQELARLAGTRIPPDDRAATRPPGGPIGGARDRWGRLAIVRRIGEGASSTVHLAKDPDLGRMVALKLYRSQPNDRPGLLSGFLDDVRSLAVIRHPNLLAVHGAGVRDGRAGMWADLVRGRTMETVLATEGPLAPARIASVGVALCRGLGALHGAGIVHGSVSTARLVQGSDDRTVLMDFTPAPSPDQALERFRTGRAAFLAPEILQGSVPGFASDVYSTGAVLYRLATGRNVIEPDAHVSVRSCIARWNVLPLGTARLSFPADLARIIHSAIAPHPADRIASARSLLDSLVAGGAGWSVF